MTVDDVPTYLPYALPPPPPPADPRRRRALVGTVAGWAVALVVLGSWYALHGRPTVKEQTTIAQAQGTVDRAIGQVVAAAGPAAVPALGGYQKAAGCGINLTRAGARYVRDVWFYTRPGTEAALLDRVAAGLPASYHATARHPAGGTGSTLAADAGDYVALAGNVPQPGVVQVVADTGCRPVGHTPATDPTGLPPEADRAPVQGLLSALGAGPVQWSVHQLPCGLRTVVAVTDRTAGTLPAPATATPATATLVSTDSVYADATGLAARITGGRVTVSRTTGTCR